MDMVSSSYRQTKAGSVGTQSLRGESEGSPLSPSQFGGVGAEQRESGVKQAWQLYEGPLGMLTRIIETEHWA